MDEKKKLELAEDQLEGVSGGCEDHDPDYYAATPPCVRCGYKYIQDPHDAQDLVTGVHEGRQEAAQLRSC